MKCVAIIPARGGSKGIPRKNLRPLAGRPMIFYAINACLMAEGNTDVVITTDDEEIALFAERFGAKVIMRDPMLANDTATLDPVIIDAVDKIEVLLGYSPELVISVQPTSPLIKSKDIEDCIDKFLCDETVETVLSVVDDRHLCWTIVDEKPLPAYEMRVNRQQLKSNYRETGAIIACRRNILNTGTRIGQNVSLLEMPQERSFDIDSLSDFYLCESLLRRKHVVLTVIGYHEVGLGHAFRAVMIANELVHHEITFLCEAKSELALNYIKSQNYKVVSCNDGCLLEAIKDLMPDIVINDLLDTDADYIQKLKKFVPSVVNFEDLGSGIKYADLVINALYPNPLPYEHVKVGAPFFCLRDEFIYFESKSFKKTAKNLLITFGGVDEGNLTLRVARLVAPLCISASIKLTVIVGPGYRHHETLVELKTLFPAGMLALVRSTTRISEFMGEADAAVTSGGRTVYELTALRIPTVVICQNLRETTHTFASSANGIVNIGHRDHVTDESVVESVKTICLDADVRQTMQKKLNELDLTKGKMRVCQLIQDLLLKE